MMDWIDVKQGLPPVSMTTSFYGLVTDGRHTFFAVRWLRRWDSITDEKEEVWTYSMSDTRDLTPHITHWMPLPEPPIEKDTKVVTAAPPDSTQIPDLQGDIE